MGTITVKDAAGSNQTAALVAATGSTSDANSLPVAQSTEHKGLVGALTETAPASDTASSGLNGRLQRIAQRISSMIALLPTALGGNGGMKVEVVGGGAAAGTAGTPGTDVLTIQPPTSNIWRYAAAAAGLVSTTGVTAKTAGGASVRNYIDSVDAWNSNASTDTELQIRDGASGTVMWRWYVKAGAGIVKKFDPPLQGTANTLVEIAESIATTTNGVYVNIQGHTGA